MKKYLIGTNNTHKLTEIRAILPEFDWVTPAQLGINVEIDETGATFEQNARIKAKTFARLSGLPTVADDSGLEVKDLNGAPGVHSHRFCPWPNATDADRRRYLVEQLWDIPFPHEARFVSYAVFFDPESGKTVTACGSIEGEILDHDRGENGFGYDALFYVLNLRKTLAELSEEQKNAISHRGQAFRALRKALIGD